MGVYKQRITDSRRAARRGAGAQPARPGSDAAILTWPAISYPYRHLYYARLDNTGTVLLAPTIYRQTRGSVIYATSRGYGVGGLPPYQLYLPLVLRQSP